MKGWRCLDALSWSCANRVITTMNAAIAVLNKFPLLRASTEHILIVRGLRAEGAFAWLYHLNRERHKRSLSITNRKATVSGGLSVTPLQFLAGVVRGGPLARIGRAQFYRARSASTGTTPRCFVPTSPSPNSPDISSAPSSVYQSSFPCRRV